MQKFEDYTYERPKMKRVKAEFEELLQKFAQAKSVDEATNAIDAINKLRNRLSTMSMLVLIRSSIDTNDEYYEKEQDFFDEVEPVIQEISTEFYKELVKTPFRDKLEEKWGKQLFQIADFEIKSFSPEIIPLLQKENKLSSQYARLVASAEVEFQGETYTLAQLYPFTEHSNRNIRKEAINAYTGFFEENQTEFDTIYDDLVKVRHEIAVTIGYKNFVELGYLRMLRIDYNAEMVEAYRQQVRDFIVPLVTKLYKKQEKRINVDQLKFHDESFLFASGNATPKGSPEWIIENGKKMYEELSEETREFFQFMLDRHLMDLEAKKGKEAGGYCAYIEDYQSPYIFANFNGTSADIDVLTHEAGHAFQAYSSRKFELPEYTDPTHEAAEIHSMSMEFFTWPWMELFFKEDTLKYKYTHLTEALKFLPYGAAVDEFQHLVYENPDWTPEERNEAWNKLEETYLPHREFDDNAYLESGRFWQRQGHIYEDPFYYIDYTLAQVCAFQFWKRAQEERESAWKDYLHLCMLGGSKSFLELVKEAGLNSPFDDGTVKSVVDAIEKWLDDVDDTKL
ncbi:M3 family oligoendopeptidase [Virgibacillus oceani]